MPQEALARLEGFLARHGEGQWAGRLAGLRAAHGDDRAALAPLCPGLARLTLTPARGHAVQVCAIDGTNRKLAALRTELCGAVGAATEKPPGRV